MDPAAVRDACTISSGRDGKGFPLTDSVAETVLLSEKKTDTCTLRLLLAQGGLSCVLQVEPGPSPVAVPSPEEILVSLAAVGITESVDRAAVESVPSFDPASFPPEGIEVAHGVPPTEPVDAAVEFLVRPDVGVSAYAVKADGSVDFHDRSDYDLIAAGQEIGRYIASRPGKPGTTVTGLPIPGQPPAVTAITLGKGIRIDRESNRLYALTAGRVLYAHETVSVEEEYLVQGDVDFAVGNIRNSGFVIVTGDVDDNFTVTGDKGIRIGGVVGAATLKSDGDISVSGMTGKGKGRVYCGGNLHARFLSEVEVECRGDVVVETEIRTSVIRAGGAILVPNGVVAGGDCIAGRGIEVKTAGSHMGVLTKLSSGTDYRLRKELDALKERLRHLEKEIARIEGIVGTEPPDEAALSRLAAGRREAIEKQFGLLAAARAEAEKLQAEIARATVQSDPTSNAMINIRGELFENTIINLWHADVRITEAVSGPLSIIENTLDGSLRFLPLHPLKKNARDIEAAILATPHA
jgi:uncharacterized protein (DUF342 family)